MHRTSTPPARYQEDLDDYVRWLGHSHADLFHAVVNSNTQLATINRDMMAELHQGSILLKEGFKGCKTLASEIREQLNENKSAMSDVQMELGGLRKLIEESQKAKSRSDASSIHQHPCTTLDHDHPNAGLFQQMYGAQETPQTIAQPPVSEHHTGNPASTCQIENASKCQPIEEFMTENEGHNGSTFRQNEIKFSVKKVDQNKEDIINREATSCITEQWETKEKGLPHVQFFSESPAQDQEKIYEIFFQGNKAEIKEITDADVIARVSAIDKTTKYMVLGSETGGEAQTRGTEVDIPVDYHGKEGLERSDIGLCQDVRAEERASEDEIPQTNPNARLYNVRNRDINSNTLSGEVKAHVHRKTEITNFDARPVITFLRNMRDSTKLGGSLFTPPPERNKASPGAQNEETTPKKSESDSPTETQSEETGPKQSESDSPTETQSEETGPKKSEKSSPTETSPGAQNEETGLKESESDTPTETQSEETGQKKSEKSSPTETSPGAQNEETDLKESERGIRSETQNEETGPKKSETNPPTESLNKETDSKEIGTDTYTETQNEETGLKDSGTDICTGTQFEEKGQRDSGTDTRIETEDEETGHKKSETDACTETQVEETGPNGRGTDARTETSPGAQNEETGLKKSERGTRTETSNKETGPKKSGKHTRTETSPGAQNEETGSKKSATNTCTENQNEETGRNESGKDASPSSQNEERKKSETDACTETQVEKTGPNDSGTDTRTETSPGAQNEETGQKENETDIIIIIIIMIILTVIYSFVYIAPKIYF